jgi:hypothetical protein
MSRGRMVSPARQFSPSPCRGVVAEGTGVLDAIAGFVSRLQLADARDSSAATFRSFTKVET